LVRGTRIKGFKNQKIIASTLINYNKRNKDILSSKTSRHNTGAAPAPAPKIWAHAGLEYCVRDNKKNKARNNINEMLLELDQNLNTQTKNFNFKIFDGDKTKFPAREQSKE